MRAASWSIPSPSPPSGRNSRTSMTTSGTRRNASRSRGSRPPATRAARTAGNRSPARGAKTRSKGVGRADIRGILAEAAGAARTRGLKEGVQQAAEVFQALHVGAVAAPVECVELRAEERCRLAGGLDRDGIVLAVQHEGRQPQPPKGGAEVVVVQASPDLLLGASDDAKRRQVAGPGRIVEVGDDRQLEQPALVGPGVPLAKPAFPERQPLRYELWRETPLGEAPLELVSGGAPGGGGADQREPIEPIGVLGRVELGQEPAPGVAEDDEAVEGPELPERLEVGDVLAPADRDVPRHRRPPAAPLVVIHQLPSQSERVEAGEEVAVVGAGAAVEDDDRRPLSHPPLEQGDAADEAGCGSLGRGSAHRLPPPFAWLRAAPPARPRPSAP